MEMKICKNCETTLETTRKTKKFCSTSCSNKYNGRKRIEERSTWNLKKENMKVCVACDQLLSIWKFSKLDKWGSADGPRKHTCKKCSHTQRERERRERSWKQDARQTMLNNCRQRSKARGLECTITKDDIVIPDVCPILGIELKRGGAFKDNSPSLDRIDNSKGYVPGNVVVISLRANAIKRDSTLEELKQIVSFYESLLTE
jgi:hypothetical protein